MTFGSSAPRQKSAGGKSRANNKHVWYHPALKHKVSSRPENPSDWLHFDSELEFSFYLSLSPVEKANAWLHHALELIPKPNQILWKPDFNFPLEKLSVEQKGEWITAPASNATKALFIHQVKLAQHAGYQVILLGSVDFLVGEFQVQNYRNWRTIRHDDAN